MFRRLILIFVIAISFSPILTLKAAAEEIPVLVWESGQTQNIVLGKGDSQTAWEIHLKSMTGKKYKLSKSVANRGNFEVFTINLPDDFPKGGYVVEASDGDKFIKQVAGVQILEGSSKEVTKVPFDLFIILSGLSLFFFYLTQIKIIGKIKVLASSNFDIESNSKVDIPFRLKNAMQAGKSTSLIKALAIDATGFDIRFKRVSIIAGLFSLGLISWLQFSTSNWMAANSMLILAALVIGNTFFTYGLVLSGLAISYLLLNITSAKTMAEIISFFVICVIFFLPSLYNQFLKKLFDAKDGNTSIHFSRANLLSALFAAFSGFQLFVLFESLTTNVLSPGFNKELLGVLLFVIFLLKNYLISAESEINSDFEVVRAIGPAWSVGLGILISLIVYIWTTNLMISIVALLSVLIILATNWLKVDSIQKLSLPYLDLYFGSILIAVILSAVYLSTQALPLDVVNRSHLAIILIFPFDLLIALYLWLNQSVIETEKSRKQIELAEVSS